jgi:hypothetical protein
MLRVLAMLIQAAPLFAAPLATPVRSWRTVALHNADAKNATSEFRITTRGMQVIKADNLVAVGNSLPDLRLHPGAEGDSYAVLTVAGKKPSSFLLVNPDDTETWDRLAAPLLSNRANTPSDLASGALPLLFCALAAPCRQLTWCALVRMHRKIMLLLC